MLPKLLLILSLIWIVSFSSGQNVWDSIDVRTNDDFVEHSRILAKKQKVPSNICKDSYSNCIELDNELMELPPNEITKRKHRKHVSLESLPNSDYTFTHFPHMHHQQTKFCSCNHEKRFADLGPNYFPRYISDMICLPGGCDKNYSCRPKRLKLWAMRKRQEDEEPGSEPIPKELREFWVGESISTTIDCECAP